MYTNIFDLIVLDKDKDKFIYLKKLIRIRIYLSKIFWDTWKVLTLMYANIGYHTWDRGTVLYCTLFYCTLLYIIVLYCTVHYCTVKYCTVLARWGCWSLATGALGTLLCGASQVLYCTLLYCTVLYCTVLYCTVLYCTVWSCFDLTRLFDTVH